MLDSLRDTINSIQHELVQGVESLKNATIGETNEKVERIPHELLEELVQSDGGSALLAKHNLQLTQLRNRTEENIRLANVCTTRMGRAQQECKERADAFIQFEAFLRQSKDMHTKLGSMQVQLDKLMRFCDQTEQSMTQLEALSYMVQTERKVEEIRKRASRLSSALSPVSTEHRPSPTVESMSAREAGDAARERHEHVMLEEFLSNSP